MRRAPTSGRSSLGSRWWPAVGVGCAVLLLAACSSSSDGEPAASGDPVEVAHARVTAAERSVTDAKATFEEASAKFCGDSKSYIAAIDRYGKAMSDAAVTVGDVKTEGADLAKPAAKVTSSADDAIAAHDAVGAAEADLVEAQAALAAAESKAAGGTPTSTSTTSTTTAPLLPTATVDRVKQAEADVAATAKGITDETALRQATEQFNAAAFSLEVAWLRVFADAGCLGEQQQGDAEAALRDYTVAQQTALQTAGYYDGKVDGVYGPSTVDAVEKLQKDQGLTVTGMIDQATATALGQAVAAKGGTDAAQAAASTAAVQSTLKLAGRWTGPVDGVWTPELTDALKAFQTELGVPATGAVDTATLQALERSIAEATSAPATTTTAPATTPTSAG